MKRTWSNPEGLVSKKPIAMRLMPAELAEAEGIAKKMGVSKSHLARVSFLKGLPLVSPEDFSAPAPSADLSGGVAAASPAGLSSDQE